VKSLFSKLNPFRRTNARFDRYYAGVVGQGWGYPTADEARRDLNRLDRNQADFRYLY
jgi:hypothetical protein